MNRRDPRIQQTLNRITDTLESANAATQTSVYDFSSQYLRPCLGSISACFSQSCTPCLNFTRERQRQRQRALMRSQRPEAVFDFYADWDDDPYEYGDDEDITGEGPVANERTGLLGGWGADELDRLLAGRNKNSGKEVEQPKRKGGMSYGTTTKGSKGSRRTSATMQKGGKAELNDPTLVPTSSKFGFLESLPFRFGARGMRYKPSAANLQEGVFDRRGGVGGAEEERQRTEGEALLEDVDEEEDDEGTGRVARTGGRARSGTNRSADSDTSYSSRGDLFPSDEEDDAVMIDDEFAITLGRRNTDDFSGPGSNASSKGKRKRPSAGSRKSTSTRSRGTRSSGASLRRNLSNDSIIESPTIEQRFDAEADAVVLPTDEELRQEEERVRREEEAEVERKRIEAHELAIARGLVQPEPESDDQTERQMKTSGDATEGDAVVETNLSSPPKTDD